MTGNTEPNEPFEIVKGLLLLLGCHMLAIAFIVILGSIVGSFLGGYSIIGVWAVGALGFLFWQLLYVLPLIIRFKRRGKIGMMKGIIIGAVITALVNGACYLASAR